MPTAQVGLELFGVPGLTLSAISFRDSDGDLFAEVIVRERWGFALIDKEIYAMCGWVYDVRKAVAGRDGGQLFRRDWDVTGGAHRSNCNIAQVAREAPPEDARHHLPHNVACHSPAVQHLPACQSGGLRSSAVALLKAHVER